MNTNAKTGKRTAAFGPETRFEIRPVATAPFRAVLENTFETLKNRLLADRLGTVSDPEQVIALRRAAHEAVALAWATPYPLLVFPALFAEKAERRLTRFTRPPPPRRPGATQAPETAAANCLS